MNWLGSRLLQRQRNTNGVNYGQLRELRRRDPNNFERVVNDVTGRVTTDASQRLEVSRGLGLNTRGLIIGGQRDTGLDSGTGLAGGRNKPRTVARGLPRIEDKIIYAKKPSLSKDINLTPEERRLQKKGLLE